MFAIRKYVTKRHNLDENFDQGFVHYCLKTSDSFTFDKIMNVIEEIKKDFPSIKDEAISIYSMLNDELDLTFFSLEIPVKMEF